jgi:hypothetical protein
MKIRSNYSIIFFTIIITILLLKTSYAGPVSEKEIELSFSIPSNLSLDNTWNIYLISVGEFNNNNWSFSQYYSKIKTDYISYKNNCGLNTSFYEEIYEMDEEERQHRACVINGTYQEIYCSRTSSNSQKCKNLIPYKIDEDNKMLSFKSYYESYVWDIKRASQYHHFGLSNCKIINNSCSLTLNKLSEPYNPYIVVLEKNQLKK